MADDKEQPIEQEFRQIMNELARQLDGIFNGLARGKDRKTCFVMLVAPFDGPVGQRCNYISNGGREDVVALMKEVTERFEAQAKVEPNEAGN